MSENIEDMKRENITLTDEVVRLTNKIKALEGKIDSDGETIIDQEAEIGALLCTFEKTLGLFRTVTKVFDTPETQDLHNAMIFHQEITAKALDLYISTHKDSYDVAVAMAEKLTGDSPSLEELNEFIENTKEVV